MQTIGTWWMWGGFFALVLGFIAMDLFLLGGRKAHRVGFREAAGWSVFWVGISLAFGAAIWFYLDGSAGRETANRIFAEYLTGYVIEKALAVDNVFVWLMIFGHFAVPLELQRRVLLYGVLGALILRTGMIFGGAWLIAQFHWLLYVFGAFLLFTGVKMLVTRDAEPDLAGNPLLRWMRRHLRVTATIENERFSVIREGKRWLTPLFVVLMLVEISDVIFAVDSIPAIFAITTDPFVVLTSNVFAILGLRAMYFLLAGMADRFVYLKPALACVLTFIGVKMVSMDWVKIPIGISLSVVASMIAIGVIASLWHTRRSAAQAR
ncbi:TerC family protein [Niveibacterium sp. SC-1]|uniref:TerC family protein n=1 Tax=Niveibacterium sp. SC-1 TaxID=3135646 RepID=UPI00311E8B5C